MQDSTIAPSIISRARYFVTLARLVYPAAGPARLVALIDAKLPALDLIVAGAVDEVITTAYIPEPGRNSLFIGLAPLAADQLFLARLLLRPDIYKAALIEDFSSLDEADADAADASERLAIAANKIWLKRYDILLPYAAPDMHPETMARDLWQTIATQMSRAALPQFAVGGRKPRIALISPLPPARSGVADYSASLAKALESNAEVTLFAPTASEQAEAVTHLPYIARRFDRVVSVMGNSAVFHGRIYELVMRYGGACICHDARLLGFYEQQCGIERMAALATAESGKPIATEEITAWLHDETIRNADFLDELAATAHPLILHAYQTAETLKARGFEQVQYLPFAIYRPWHFGALTPVQKRNARKRLGLAADQKLIVSLGFISDNKGIEEALQAMAILCRGGTDVSLIWVGQSETDIARWRWRAGALGLGERVRFLDQYLEENIYRDYLLAADGGLQLRRGGAGNISGALQDCIAAGLPAVANSDLAASLNAPSYVMRVADRLDPDEIAAALGTMLTSNANTDLARADYTSARSMTAYAEGLCKLLEVG